MIKSLQTNILDDDMIATAKKIQQRKVTIEQVVTAYITHIQYVNPAINALAENRFAAALEEARAKDKSLPTDFSKLPLYGVPITIKESFDVAHMKTTGGLIHLKDNVVTDDAPLVKRLRDAGAIILGKTNTATLCYAQESDNKLYGRTNNPWDVTRTAGGSTGGEGALLAVGGATAGIGSDIGGSIRLPSHFNGVIGFKSGKYTIKNDGHFPAATIPLQQRMESYGPMGKSVRDMKLLYEIMTGKNIQHDALTNVTINIFPTDIDLPLDQATGDLIERITSFLAKSYPIERTIPPYFHESAEIWQEVMSINGSEHIETLTFNNEPSTFRVLRTYFREKLRHNTNYHHYLLWALLGSKLFKPNQQRIKTIERIIANGDAQLDKRLENELLIFPVYHSATKHHGAVFSEIFSIKKTFKQYMPYLAYANVWGLPALTIPLGYDANNMPIALQIMGLVGNEGKIFALGEKLAKQFTGYSRCDHHDP